MSNVTITNTEGQSLKMGLAICMDINYKDFLNQYEYELGDSLKQNQCDGLLFIAGWSDFLPLDIDPK
jgi:predicted amidohydrolase